MKTILSLLLCFFCFTTVAQTGLDDQLLRKALMVAPETVHKIDTIYRSDFSDEVIQCQVAPGHCDVLPQGDFINLNFEGQDMSGKRICISNHILFYVTHLQGSENNPAIISNCGGIGRITDNNKAIWLRKSQHVRITGTGHSGYPIGLKLVGAHNTIDATDGSSNISIDHVDVSTSSTGGTGTGISMRTYPACEDGSLQYTRPQFTQYDSVVRDSYIHDTKNEGLYIGTSHHQLEQGYSLMDCNKDGNQQPSPQADLIGVRVENNILFNIGGDGIQVGAAVEDAQVKNNVVLDFGMVAGWPHVQGIEVNPGSKLQVENNWIETRRPDLSGVALSIQGAGGSQYINNLFVGMDKAIHGLRSTGPNDDAHVIWYNTIVLSGQTNAASIWCSDEFAANNLDFANNLIVNSTTPWADSQFGGSGCWQETGQWFSQDISSLGLANVADDLYWPVTGSALINQAATVSPQVTTDLMGRTRTSNDPGAFAAQQ